MAPQSSTTVATGDFDGYAWTMSVEVFESIGPCLRIAGAPMPEERDQLASAACNGPIQGLQWSATSAAVGEVVYGHAPADAAAVELRRAGYEPRTATLYRHDDFPNVAFFVTRQLPAPGPEEVVALDADGRELARRGALRARPLAYGR